MTPQELKQLRLRAGLSQEALARLLGVSWGSVNRWERGNRTIRTLNAAAIRTVISNYQKTK